jgi:hypothetical protein
VATVPDLTPPKEKGYLCGCGYTASRKDLLTRHQSKCLFVTLTATILERDKTIDVYDKTIKENVKTILTLTKNHEKTIAKLTTDHEKSVGKLEERIDKLMERPVNITNNTNTINNNQKYNMSFYKQYVIENFEAITPPLLENVMGHMTLTDISHGGAGFAKLAKRHLDHQHVLVLDQARRKGIYKDAKGEVKVDAKLRDLLALIGEAGHPIASEIFKKWISDNPNSLSCVDKSKVLSRLLNMVGWLSRLKNGETVDEDSGMLGGFLEEFVSGYTKEALHNHLERDTNTVPMVNEVEVEMEVAMDFSDEYSVYDLAEDTRSVGSLDFEVLVGVRNYEVSREKGMLEEENLYVMYKERSNFATSSVS